MSATTMSSSGNTFAKFAFWSLVAVAVVWAMITISFEVGHGIPVTREEWGHRIIGWFISALLLRTFIRGVRHYYRLLGTNN